MIPPKKSLGQHFLKNTKVVTDMIEAAHVSPSDTVLEIGPGEGVLTEALLARAKRVIAVEKDDRLIEFLTEHFAKAIEQGRFTLIHGDALDFDPVTLDLSAGSYKLIANIPYYVTGAILRHFLSIREKPSLMTLLVQKEVAERIVAKEGKKDGKESILSISVKAYGTPEYIRTVKSGNFSPPPKVDSAILSIQNISNKRFKNISEEKFFNILRAGFAHKRKLLLSNLREAGVKTNVERVPPRVRPEDLSLEDWIHLAEK